MFLQSSTIVLTSVFEPLPTREDLANGPLVRGAEHLALPLHLLIALQQIAIQPLKQPSTVLVMPSYSLSSGDGYAKLGYSV